MFYITTPDGKIEISEITYECPICGNITIYQLGDEDYCYFCEEERRKREEELLDARLFSLLASYLSHEHNRHYTPEEAKLLLERK